MIDALHDRPSAHQRHDITAGGGNHIFHLQPLRDSLQHRQIVRFHQANDIRIAGENHLRQRISAAFATIKDVVADDFHALAVTDGLSGRVASLPLIAARQIVGHCHRESYVLTSGQSPA